MFEDKPIFRRINEKRKNELAEIRKEKMAERRGKYKNPPFSYSHPITCIFENLSRALINNSKFDVFDHIYYEVIDQKAYCSAREMYRHIIMDISVKHCMIVEALHRFLFDKAKIFEKISKSGKNPRTGQKEVQFNTEYWHILNDIELLIVLIRSIMDLIAQLTPMFFLDKNSPPNRSFTKQVKWFHDKEQDSELMEYFDKNFDWFKKLREIRNDISHYGSLQLGFQDEVGQVELVVLTRKFDLLLGKINIESELKKSVEGLGCFLEFYETYFLQRLKKA